MEPSIPLNEKNEYQPKINAIRKAIYAEDKRLQEEIHIPRTSEYHWCPYFHIMPIFHASHFLSLH